MESYELLKACEQQGAGTVEIREKNPELDDPLEGVAGINLDGNVGCFIGADDGSDDCILTPDEFNRRFKILTAIFTEG